MIGFEYYNPAKIVFGEDSGKSLKSLLAQNKATSLLLVYSGDFIKTLGIYDVIKEAVDALGIRFSESGEVVPNPSIELVRKLVAQFDDDVKVYPGHGDSTTIGDEKAYNELTADFLTQLKPLGIPLELNRLGFADGRHYPRRAFWEKCGEMGIPAVIGLDAHDPAVFQDEESVDRLIAFGRECGVRILPELELPDGYTE